MTADVAFSRSRAPTSPTEDDKAARQLRPAAIRNTLDRRSDHAL
jgi:hypothetical protein